MKWLLPCFPLFWSACAALAATNSVRPAVEIEEEVFTSFFTATIRAGSPPSNTLELLGERAGKPRTISYARIQLIRP